MLRHEANKAARELRAALAGAEDLEFQDGYGPDAAAAEFAGRFAGPPARGRRCDEPAIIYPQAGRPALCFGAYGSEGRVRGWLPGLPDRIAPTTLATFAPIEPLDIAGSDHDDLGVGGLDCLPIPKITPRDAGAYITMGFILADGGQAGIALSAHRMLVLGPDRLGVWMLPGRKLRELAAAAHAEGRGLPVSVNIGVPPAAAISSAVSTRYLPEGWTKLSLAGALACAPMELAEGLVPGVRYMARSEIVLEGEILPETVPEALPGMSIAGSMPEFLGYDGGGQGALALLLVRHVRARPSALFQAVVGPGREQSVILGLGGALTVGLGMGPNGGAIHDLRFSHAGGGMLLLFVSLREGRCADLATLAAQIAALCPFAKTIVFVDDDVDLHSEEDVLWAMTTRAQLAEDCHPIPGQSPLPMDPSQSAEWITAKGTTVFKSYVDATVPDHLRAAFRRSFD